MVPWGEHEIHMRVLAELITVFLSSPRVPGKFWENGRPRGDGNRKKTIIKEIKTRRHYEEPPSRTEMKNHRFPFHLGQVGGRWGVERMG